MITSSLTFQMKSDNVRKDPEQLRGPIGGDTKDQSHQSHQSMAKIRRSGDHAYPTHKIGKKNLEGSLERSMEPYKYPPPHSAEIRGELF